MMRYDDWKATDYSADNGSSDALSSPIGDDEPSGPNSPQNGTGAQQTHSPILATPKGRGARKVRTKRPRPYVTSCQLGSDDWAWTPERVAMFDDEGTRLGDGYALCRPGDNRWPLGFCGAHYSVLGHVDSHAEVMAWMGEYVRYGGSLIVGHGYHVINTYTFTRNDVPFGYERPVVTTRLHVDHDHTAKGARLMAATVYVGDEPIGSPLRLRALHVGGSSAGQAEAMSETIGLLQVVLGDLVDAAHNVALSDDVIAHFVKRGIVSAKGKHAKSALDYVLAWYKGDARGDKITWNTWARRMGDEAIRALVAIPELSRFAAQLDDVLRAFKHQQYST